MNESFVPMLLIDSVWPRIVLDTVNDCAAAPESTNQPIKQPTKACALCSLHNGAVGIGPVALVCLVDLFQSRLGGRLGLFHLVLDLVDVLLLLSDNVRQVPVDLVDLVHPLVDLSDFFLPLPHDFFLEAVLLNEHLLLLECRPCLVVGRGRRVPRSRSSSRRSPLLELLALPRHPGLECHDGGLNALEIPLQLGQGLLLRAGLGLVGESLALGQDLFLELSLELSQHVVLGLVLLHEFFSLEARLTGQQRLGNLFKDSDVSVILGQGIRDLRRGACSRHGEGTKV
mmetsp:Transcript_3541/g.9968  ORF Transcript_3541/g.9968 Transcript_3541/m.9968 type:complete len:285 (+) Transcript_3541:2106-2960(+)